MIIPPGIVASAKRPVGGGEGEGEGGGTSLAKYTYAYTGAEQNVYVPSGCTAMRVKLWGAGGGGGCYGGGTFGGGGGFAIAEIPVTPGQKITVQVGQGGAAGAAIGAYPDGSAGAYGDVNGGGGAGSSRVWIDEVIAAVAGAGGGSCGYIGYGGNGGGLSGTNGANGGSAGTQSAPGGFTGNGYPVYGGNDACANPASTAWENGKPEALVWADRNCQRGGFGGPQGGGTGGDGGGGGGGYYGGGGGSGDGRSGGGGSGYIKPSAFSGGFDTGLHNASAGSYDPDFPGGVVAKGSQSCSGQPGGNGFVVVDFLDGPVPVSKLAQSIMFVTDSGPPNSKISRLGKRYASGPYAVDEWNKGGSRIARCAQDGDWIFELTLTEKTAGTTVAIGVGFQGIGLGSGSGGGNNAGDGGRYQYFENGAGRINGNYFGFGAAYGEGDVIGIRITDVGGTTLLRAYKNGVLQGTLADLGSLATYWEPHVCNYGNGASNVILDAKELLYLPIGAKTW